MKPTRIIQTLIAACISILVLSGCALQAEPQPFDLVIENGRVMDPETKLDAIRSVGIRAGKIVAISEQSLQGKETINAAGLVVAPGFIDMHAHVQSDVTFKLHAQDGVTTALELEYGAYPVKRWYDDRAGKAAINYGVSTSHILARATVFGALNPNEIDGSVEDASSKVSAAGDSWMTKPATPEQLDSMSDLLSQGLSEGGVGLGYHLAVTPGADVDEMLYFYQFSAEKNVGNYVHIRSFGSVSPTEAGREVVAAAEKTGAAIHVVHIGSSGLWETRDVLDILYTGQQKGLALSTEVYPYTAAESSMDDPRANEESLKSIGATFADLELVETGERLTKETFYKYKKTKPHAELAAHIMKPADVDAAITHPMTMIASDGGNFIDGRGHPRGAGTFARILGHYVREKQNLSLMDGIKKMTLMPAQVLEGTSPDMKQRGRIQAGMIADITIFDPEIVGDAATYMHPIRPSKGIAHVLVNGQAIVRDYHLVEDAYPGLPIWGALKTQ